MVSDLISKKDAMIQDLIQTLELSKSVFDHIADEGPSVTLLRVEQASDRIKRTIRKAKGVK